MNGFVNNFSMFGLVFDISYSIQQEHEVYASLLEMVVAHHTLYNWETVTKDICVFKKKMMIKHLGNLIICFIFSIALVHKHMHIHIVNSQ